MHQGKVIRQVLPLEPPWNPGVSFGAKATPPGPQGRLCSDDELRTVVASLKRYLCSYIFAVSLE